MKATTKENQDSQQQKTPEKPVLSTPLEPAGESPFAARKEKRRCFDQSPLPQKRQKSTDELRVENALLYEQRRQEWLPVLRKNPTLFWKSSQSLEAYHKGIDEFLAP